MSIVNFILEHWQTILTILIPLVSFIVGVTDSPKDDSVWGAILRFLGRLGVTTHKDEPGTLKLPGKSAAPLFYREK